MLPETPVPSAPEKRPRYTINAQLSPDAYRIVRDMCPLGCKTLGRFLDRLVYEFAARAEERQREKHAVTCVEG